MEPTVPVADLKEGDPGKRKESTWDTGKQRYEHWETGEK